MVSTSMRLKWYKRRDVQDAIVKAAHDKEIAVLYGDKGFGKRPDVIKHPKDVLELAKQGATSFHCSEELWDNPMHIVTGMRQKELNNLRIGWDLILDLDCPVLEFSQITAHVLIEALNYYGIKSFAVKFSGNHGFHISIPFEAFPKLVKNVPTKNLFPEGPRKIAAFLQERTRLMLADKLLESYSLSTITKKLDKSVADLTTKGEFDPYKVVDVDTVLIASRHLYRMPYSFNEKSGLISIPIKPEDVLDFNKEQAKFENVKVDLDFIDRKKVVPGEARRLFIEAFDMASEEVEKKELISQTKTKLSQETYEKITEKISEDFFPPCIKKGLQGLIDGKKRFVFIAINFLSSIGWSHNEIENLLLEWNKKNEEPLRETILRGQLNHKKNKEAVLPPNCDNKSYMQDMQICNPDNFCKKVKNPVNYAVFKHKAYKINEKQKKNEN